MTKERVLHSERRPYVTVSSLGELVGPTTGLVELPLRLDWSEQGTYDLDEPGELSLMYERVLREAMEVQDLRRYLNTSMLREVWPQLFLPQRVRELWERRFPELADDDGSVARALGESESVTAIGRCGFWSAGGRISIGAPQAERERREVTGA